MRRSSPIRLLFLIALVTASFAASVLASAPGVAQERPKVGLQFLTAGLSLNPGLLVDDAPDAEQFSDVALTAGGTLRLGFQHVVATQLYMAAEVELGNHWFNEHTASPVGRADSSVVFAWQIGLLGRWVPGGDEGGLSMGFGAHIWRASLEEAPLQVLAGDLRLGWYFWQGLDFLLAEIGYGIPLIAGLDLATNFTGEGPQAVDQNWTFHRFSIGFSYGF